MNKPPPWDISVVTLEEVATWLAVNIDDGANCPCCGQLCKVWMAGFELSHESPILLPASTSVAE